MMLTVLVVARQVIALRENLVLQREHALRAGEARFRSLVQHATDVIAILEPDSTISFVSPSASACSAAAPASWPARRFLDLVHPDDVADARTRLSEAGGHAGAGADGALAARAIATARGSPPTTPAPTCSATPTSAVCC